MSGTSFYTYACQVTCGFLFAEALEQSYGLAYHPVGTDRNKERMMSVLEEKEFGKILTSVVRSAREQGNTIAGKEVEEAFASLHLT